MNLGMAHIKRPGKFFGCGDRFFNGKRGKAGRNGNAVFGEQFFALIFVNVHGREAMPFVDGNVRPEAG